MSTTVDSRVVEMRFDNKQFESNVQTTLSSLNKLKQSLNLEGATKGLKEVDAAAKKCDMSGLNGAVETVRTKFSALQVMGVTALANITNAAFNAGKRIASSLTIEPIKMGFQEYETQLNAVQTILANTSSKGTTLEDVNGALDTLNTYADKTIYNFTEMTRNIGTFTAAGVDLDTSVSSIQGIANLAAVSGSTSQQASTAMYQLSQALASGTVKLMDWNSVVNAGMGGQVFQDALKRTAKNMGTNVDAMIEKNGSFRESLKEGWLTADVLTKTLEQFTMAAEEGSEEWNKYKKSLMDEGYTAKQAEEILKMANTATDAATKVKTFTQLFDTLKEAAQSGWAQSWEIIVGDFEEAKELFTSVSDVLGGMIGKSAEARNKVLQGWKDMGGRTAVIDAIKNAFEGVMSVVEPIGEAFREIFPPITAKQLVAFSEGLKNLTEKFKIGDKTANNLKRTFKGVFALLDIGVQAIKALFSGFGKLIGYVAPAGDGILGFTAKIGDFIVGIDEAIKSSDAFNKVIEGIGKFLKPIAEGIKAFGKSISDSFGSIVDKAEVRFEPLTALGEFIKGIFVGLGNVIGKIFPFISKAVTGISGAIGSLMEKITSSIQGADYSNMFDFVNGGIFAAIGVFIAKIIKSGGDILDNAGGFLENINDILGGVSDSLKAFTGAIKAEALKKIATAIAILAGSLLVMSLIDSEKLTASLVGVTILFGELMGAMSIFGKIAEGKSIKGLLGMSVISKAMLTLSKSLLVLSVAMKILGSMSIAEMGVAILGLTVGLGSLVAAVNLLPKGNMLKAAKAIQKLSSALLVLSISLKIMSTISIAEMGVALLGLVVGLGSLVAAVNLLPKDTALRAAGLLGLATAMVILSGALKIMATMSWDDIARSLVTLGGSLLILAGAMALMKSAVPGALAMLIVAPALVVLASAMKIMGSMSWEEIARGLVTLGGALLIIAGAMALMKTALPGAAALLVVTASLAVLAPVLKLLGSMSWEEIARGLVAIAGAFTILGIAGLVLGPLVPTILGLSAAITLLGVGCLAIGAGVAALGVGLTAIAASGSAAAVALVTIVSSVIGLIPYMIEQIGVGIIKLCEVISGSASAICEAFTVIVLAIVDALVAAAPAVAEGALVLIESILTSLATHAPTIISALFDFLIGVIDGVAARLPDLIQAGVNLLMSFFQGVIDALKGIDTGVLIEGILAVGMLSALVIALAAIAALTPAAMIGVIGLGVVVTELALVLAAIGALAQIPGLDWLISEGGNLMQTIGTAIGQFIGGIIGGVAQGMTSSLPQIGTDLSNFMTNVQPFIDGVKLIDSTVLEGVKALAGAILALTGANILEGIASFITGESSISAFAAELPILGQGLAGFSASVAGIDTTAVASAASAAKTLAEMTATIPNEGGVVAWFAGENSIASFASQLPALGQGLLAFSTSVAGISAENITAAASAAKSLADMASVIPNEGGVVAWFAGENSIASFASQLPILGWALSGFSTAVAGVNAENITAAAEAAKTLANMTTTIPNEGGMVAWFTGENSVASFASQLPALGMGLLAFSTSVEGINAENITAAANAAKALAEMANTIPNEGGIVAWFTGENSMTKFADKLPTLGKGLKGFSDSLKGINATNISAAARAGKNLAEMADTAPEDTDHLIDFGTNLVSFGEKLSSFFTKTKGISSESVSATTNAIKSLKSATKGLDGTSFKTASKGMDSMVKSIKNMSSVTEKSTSGFVKAMKKLGETNIKALLDAFKDAEPKLTKAGKSAMEAYVKGLKSQSSPIKTAVKNLASGAVSAIKTKVSSFKGAGQDLGNGLVAGIRSKYQAAYDAGYALGQKAVQGEKDGQKSASPSKLTIQAGKWLGEGLIVGMQRMGNAVYNAGRELGKNATSSISSAVSRVADAINSDIDTQPTIRPVLDLSAVSAGAGAINGMLGFTPSIGVLSNVRAINSMMNRNQNGGNKEVVSAIKDLKDTLGNATGDSYTINGVTYSEGSDVSDAVKTLVRAVTVGRRK